MDEIRNWAIVINAGQTKGHQQKFEQKVADLRKKGFAVFSFGPKFAGCSHYFLKDPTHVGDVLFGLRYGIKANTEKGDYNNVQVHLMGQAKLFNKYMSRAVFNELMQIRKLKSLRMEFKDGMPRLPSAVPYLLELYKKGPADVRMRAQKALMKLRVPDAIPAFIKALKTYEGFDNVFVRKMIVYLMVGIKDPRIVPPLVKILEYPGVSEYKVQSVVRKALLWLRDPEIVVPLVRELRRVARDERSIGVGQLFTQKLLLKVIANNIYVGIKNPVRLIPFLRKSASRGGTDQTTLAVRALSKIKDSQVVPVLIDVILKRRDTRTRVAAVKELGRRKDPRAVKPLISTLNGRDPWVRKAAIEALKKFNTPEAQKALQLHKK